MNLGTQQHDVTASPAADALWGPATVLVVSQIHKSVKASQTVRPHTQTRKMLPKRRLVNDPVTCPQGARSSRTTRLWGGVLPPSLMVTQSSQGSDIRIKRPKAIMLPRPRVRGTAPHRQLHPVSLRARGGNSNASRCTRHHRGGDRDTPLKEAERRPSGRPGSHGTVLYDGHRRSRAPDY